MGSLDMLSSDPLNAQDILADEDSVGHMCSALGALGDGESLSRALSVIANIFSAASVDQCMSDKTEQLATNIIGPIMHVLSEQDTNIGTLFLHMQGMRALACISAAARTSQSIHLRDSLQHCASFLQRKVVECSALSFASRCTSTLQEMHGEFSTNLSMCA